MKLNSSGKSILKAALLAACATLLISCASSGRQEESKVLGYAVASWYGPDFHGKLTASGERYDMNSLTCAHKRLPFGTKLKLINVENEKATVVVVNDRGPFVRGRSLDLSKAAAAELGLIGPGTGKLKVVYLGRDYRYKKYLSGKTLQKSKARAKRAEESAAEPEEELYTIQVGAFLDQGNAEYIKAGLELNHKEVYIMEATVNGQRFFRVRVGRFDTEDEAIKNAEALADEGYDSAVLPFERQG